MSGSPPSPSTWESFISRERPLWLRYLVLAIPYSIFMLVVPVLQRFHSLGVATLNVTTVVLVTMYAGTGPGLLSALLSALLVDYYLIEPQRRILTGVEDYLFVGSFLIVSSAISLLIASLRRAYQRAEVSRKQALLAVRAREDVLAFVSHDLRNPVASVKLNVQLLRKELGRTITSGELKCLERIERSTAQMDGLIRDLLDATRIEAGELRIDSRPADLTALAREAILGLETLALHNGVTLYLEEAPPRAQTVVDRDRIHQVFSNLIGNAIKFTPAGGSIRVRIAERTDCFEVSVQDTGVGIAAADLGKVFERSWQARQSKAKLGAGLGLYISQGIVRAHGGMIQVESEPGQGTIFTFTLPLANVALRRAPSLSNWIDKKGRVS